MVSARDVALLRDHAGPELLERLEHLDRTRSERPRDAALRAPDGAARLDADVVFLGGGLSLLIAAELARLGRSVIVLERAQAGRGHREWNASEPELEPLVTSGALTREELDQIVVARYREGICRFHGSPPTRVTGVLDHAVDASALLERVRTVAERRGVRFVDGASVTGLGAGDGAVAVRWAERSQPHELTARIAVDARGASSPYASADLVCPTVGGVFRGLEHDPERGDILVTTEHAERGRQHVWEGFPGRPGELTVYLFYYAERARAGSLAALYARLFDSIGRYQAGAPELVRPTFGYIPGWSRLTPRPRGPHPRVVLVGDAAARHSPLTFCGFGSMLRSFERVAARVDGLAASRGVPGPARALPSGTQEEEPIHAWTGFLARMMASERLEGDRVNALLGAAFASLAELGNEAYAALLQDRLPAPEFVGFLRRTARKRPSVYREVVRTVGLRPLLHWTLRLGRDALLPAA